MPDREETILAGEGALPRKNTWTKLLEKEEEKEEILLH